ncbi:MAG: Do family serine endopeptidase [Oligoflexia bacterium]|nr:Do family serine endopeptidase [Oligoflexia bacterium]
MKKSLNILGFLVLFLALGFGVGTERLGNFFIRLGSLTAQAEKAAPITDNLKDLFVELSKQTVPSVVNIYTTQVINTSRGMGPQAELYRQFFEQFFGEEFVPNVPQGPQSKKATSLGTGFIIDEKEGLILTNYHVIADADEIKVILTEEDREQDGIDAKVVGGDAEADVALIKIKTNRKLKAAVFGDSDALQVGEWVMAIGNPFGHGHTVTKGIISAKERIVPISQFSNYIQTDTPINPGNSGGPLIDTSGRVIGINTAINAAAQGIGFAIPINYVKKILPDLRTKGAVTRGFVGVNIADITPQIANTLRLPKNTSGIVVSEVLEGEPADKAGVQVYDVITAINGKKIVDGRQLVNMISSFEPGTKISLDILRKGRKQNIKVTVGKRPTRDSMLSKRSSPKNKARNQSLDIGMSVENLDNELKKELGLPNNAQGVVVSRVTPGSSAEEAGFERGDLIVEVDQKPTFSTDEFWELFTEKKVYLIRFRRDGGIGIASLDLSK